MESPDYKMEEATEVPDKLVPVRSETYTEQEKKEAFKKKLRKFSGKTKGEGF